MTDQQYACEMPSCSRPPRRFIALRGRVSGTVHTWHACDHHAQLIHDTVRAMWLRSDPDGVMAFGEGELPANCDRVYGTTSARECDCAANWTNGYRDGVRVADRTGKHSRYCTAHGDPQSVVALARARVGE